MRIDRFVYDQHGDLVLAENPSSRVEFRYDADGRVIAERQGDDFTIASTYDASGNRTERKTRLVADSDVVEHTVRYEYDALDAVIAIQIDDAAPIVLERDAVGQVCVEQLSPELRRELSYEAGGQLAKQTLLGGTGLLFASEYAYDANDELVEKRDSRTGVERFKYDPVGRIVAHTDPTGRLRSYVYDPAGDLLKTHIHERRTAGATEMTQTGTWVREGEFEGHYHAYDRAGNLIRRQDVGQDLTLRWDAAGQLAEAVAVRPAIAGAGGGRSVSARSTNMMRSVAGWASLCLPARQAVRSWYCRASVVSSGTAIRWWASAREVAAREAVRRYRMRAIECQQRSSSRSVTIGMTHRCPGLSMRMSGSTIQECSGRSR